MSSQRSTNGISAGKTARESFRCTECGATAVRWVGRCQECQAWGTVAEAGAGRSLLPRVAPGAVRSPAVSIDKVDVESARTVATGIGELDRVLGGGVVPGSVVLMAGEPGIGKSTLLLAVAKAWAERSSSPSLIVTGEESAAQVRIRGERTDSIHPQLFLAAENDLAALVAHTDAVQPGLLVVDSVQTIANAQVEGTAGGVSQIRAVATELIRLAKERSIATVLVGHVTKDGSIAGPRLLEHLVDVVLQVEGDRHSSLRIVRAVKNRFGTTDEVGCFELTEQGIVELPDPSGLFLSHRARPVAGTCVTVSLEGRRPLVAEVQALVSTPNNQQARRSVNDLDSGRVAMTLAVLVRHGRVMLGDNDVYTSSVGGIAVTEPAADLAIALAVASAVRDVPLLSTMVALGEVSLSGDIRAVSNISRRLAEAARLGFRTALVPASGELINAPDGMRLIPVGHISDALVAVANLNNEVTPMRRAGLRDVTSTPA
jgi:DNA repair protein RadA/Sms